MIHLIDLLHNSIWLIKWIFLAYFLPNFSTICSHMLSKFDKKSIQKSLIFSTKANDARGLIIYSLGMLFIPLSAENKGLIEENKNIQTNFLKVKDLYELKENENWRDITEKVLKSYDTPQISKEAIANYRRRIFIFKYPSDNLWIKGFISFTPMPDTHPLLILYRWGNTDFALMNPGVVFATYKNYTVISSTLRGGISEGKDEFGGKDVDDMKNLFNYLPTLSKELGIDLHPHCVFMLGPSRGGMEMFLTLSRFPELQKHVNKIVSLSAILDLHQLIKDRPNDMKLMLENQFGLSKDHHEKQWITKRDPLESISKIEHTLPILIVQGTADPRISTKQSQHMVNLLQNSGHVVNYWEIKGGDHVLMNHPNIMNEIANWLEKDTPCMSLKMKK